MRARLRYLVRSPRTPQRLSHHATVAGLVLAALAALVLAASGIPSHLLVQGLALAAEAGR